MTAVKGKGYLIPRAMAVCVLLAVLTCLLLLALVLVSSHVFWRNIIVVSGGIALLGIAYLGYRWVFLPARETERMLSLFVSGYTLQDIYNLQYPFSRGMEEALNRFQDLLNKYELLGVTKKQAQYLALQNQINPHFLYNTLEGIRGEALMMGLSSVANMTEALATFFRYTISNVDQLVTLEDELGNIQNYYAIQQYRFGDRIHLSIAFDELDRTRVLNCRIPKITLQPIVENAIIHGIENKMGAGHIRISLVATDRRLMITISDDGVGMEEYQLQALNRKLSTTFYNYLNPEQEETGGIAILNVNNRIQLLFGEEYGIVIHSTKLVGTDVQITLPVITERVADSLG